MAKKKVNLPLMLLLLIWLKRIVDVVVVEVYVEASLPVRERFLMHSSSSSHSTSTTTTSLTTTNCNTMHTTKHRSKDTRTLTLMNKTALKNSRTLSHWKLRLLPFRAKGRV